jgi:hypothetical protein
MKILVALPSFRMMITAQTAQTLYHLRGLLDDTGIGSHLVNIEGADIVVARNTLATVCLRSPDFTHIFFVDDDMMFDPHLVIEMLRADKDIISVLAPKRKLNLDRFYDAAMRQDPIAAATARSLDFVMRLPKGQTEVTITDGMTEVEGIGMAVTLIKREVLETMVAKGVVEPRKNRNMSGEKDLYTFFDPVYDPEEDNTLSEDYSFCQRWVKGCGGKIFALTHHAIGHIGPYVFHGRYADLAGSAA